MGEAEADTECNGDEVGEIEVGGRGRTEVIEEEEKRRREEEGEVGRREERKGGQKRKDFQYMMVEAIAMINEKRLQK